MKWLFYFFVLLSFNSLGQFSPIYTIPSDFSGFDVKSFEMNENGRTLLITRPYDGGPITDLMVYTSSDYGQTWDSTFFSNRSMSRYNSCITSGGNYYFSSIVNVPSIVNPPGYMQKIVNRSLDFGNSWQETIVDSVNGGLFENALKFLNDSTGMFFYQKGQYLSTDYGVTWQKVYNKNAEHLGILDDRFIFYTYEDAFTYNPILNQMDSLSYLPYCAGNVDQSFFRDGVSYRMMYASDGQQQGYTSFPSNYAGFNIDTLPLGNQRVIHFPQRAALVDIEVTANCIHLVLDGRYVRSCDGGNTFYDVDAFNGNVNEQVLFADFINDTLGFLISVNLISFEYRLWKTTNGGGPNGAPVLTNTFYANTTELTKNLKAEVFPNPSVGNLTVSSEVRIDQLDLYSLDGRKCLEMKPEGKQVELNLSHLAKGTYLLQIKGEGAQVTKKIVIE